MARTKGNAPKASAKTTAKKVGGKASTTSKAPAKTQAKAPAKTQAKQPKAPTKVSAKASAKQAKTSTVKQPAKAPAKVSAKARTKSEEKSTEESDVDYSNMKVPELREALESRGLESKGLKPALIARLKAADKSGNSDAEEEETGEIPDEEPSGEASEEEAETQSEEPEEEAPAEKPKVKAPVKSKAPVKVKAPVKSKAPVKVKEPVKSKVSAKGGKKQSEPEEFPNVSIPDVTYTIDAKTLSALIHKAKVDTFTKSDKEFYQKLYSALEDYVSPTPGEESEEEHAPELPSEKKPKMAVTFDEDLGAFVEPTGKYLLDPISESVFAKIVEGEVVALEKADLTALSRFKIYSDDEGLLVDRPDEEFNVALEKLLQTSQEFHENASNRQLPKTEEEKPSVKILKGPEKPEGDEKEEEKPKGASDEKGDEGEEEGGDDGEEVEIEGDKDEGDTDVIDEVEKEEEELTTKRSNIDETTFAKFLQAQHSEGVAMTDYVAIAKKAGISSNVGEQIILQYKLLSDQYPLVVASFKAKKAAPPKPSLPEKEKEVPAPQGQRRLIKKK